MSGEYLCVSDELNVITPCRIDLGARRIDHMFEGDRHDERAPSVGARSVRAAATLAPVADSHATLTVATGEPDLDALMAGLARLDGAAVDDAERITQLDALERVKAACAAAQARITAAFVESQVEVARRWRQHASECSRTGDFDGWAAAREHARLAEFEEAPEGDAGRHRSVRGRVRPGSGVSAQVGLARRESPARAARIVGVSLALVRHLPNTHAALTRGLLSERRAEIVARGTSHLSPELREAVDLEVIGAHRDACGAWATGSSSVACGHARSGSTHRPQSSGLALPRPSDG
jgi:hypothetical protein